MDLLHNLYTGFTIALTWQNLLCCTAGVFFGQLIGILPGIGAPTAIALLLPLTFSLNPTSAIIMFAGIYYGVAYGGTVTSVPINVPGESSSVMTCIDGYAMPRRDERGLRSRSRPLGRSSPDDLHRSADVLCPALARFALRFGPAEYFGLAVMAFGLLTVFGSGSPFKIIVSTVAGVLISTVGMDGVSGMPRSPSGHLSFLAASISSSSFAGSLGWRGLQQHRGAGRRSPCQREVQTQ